MLARLFGLTGGIASGKSTVAAFLRDFGVVVLDADQVARDVVAPGSAGLRDIVAAFGDSVLAPDGSLDRKGLGAVVFGDEAARRRLEQITHPLIRMETMERVMRLGEEGHPLIAYEAALLVETGQADSFRPLVAVVADEAVRVARLVARDALSRQQAEARLRAQMPQQEKARVADHVIDTTCSLEEVRTKTAAVLQQICVACNVDPSRYLVG